MYRNTTMSVVAVLFDSRRNMPYMNELNSQKETFVWNGQRKRRCYDHIYHRSARFFIGFRHPNRGWDTVKEAIYIRTTKPRGVSGTDIVIPEYELRTYDTYRSRETNVLLSNVYDAGRQYINKDLFVQSLYQITGLFPRTTSKNISQGIVLLEDPYSYSEPGSVAESESEPESEPESG